MSRLLLALLLLTACGPKPLNEKEARTACETLAGERYGEELLNIKAVEATWDEQAGQWNIIGVTNVKDLPIRRWGCWVKRAGRGWEGRAD